MGCESPTVAAAVMWSANSKCHCGGTFFYPWIPCEKASSGVEAESEYLHRESRSFCKTPDRTIFLFGFFIGVLLINLWTDVFIGNTGFLDEELLYQMKYARIDNDKFFDYVFLFE